MYRALAISILLLCAGLYAFAQDVLNPQTNASALSTGTLPAGRLPALTGDVTTSVGTAATTLAAGSASNLNSGTLGAARMPALTGDCTTSAGAVATTCTKTNNVAFTGAATAVYTAAGSWTPSDGSGASLTFSSVSASYTQIGNMVFAYGQIVYPVTANGSNAVVAGLPVATPNAAYGRSCNIVLSDIATGIYIWPNQNATTIGFRNLAATIQTNTNMSNHQVNFICIYPAT